MHQTWESTIFASQGSDPLLSSGEKRIGTLASEDGTAQENLLSCDEKTKE